VKHVTVNADQAVVTDSVVTRGSTRNETVAPGNLLTVGKDNPMDIETRPRKLGGGTKPK
jgi:hypothetical protein